VKAPARALASATEAGRDAGPSAGRPRETGAPRRLPAGLSTIPRFIPSTMDMRETWEMLSYVVTVIGLPFAIVVFILEQRKERKNEDEEIYQRLSDEYREFLKLVLDNADLHMLRRDSTVHELTPEQDERRYALFGILISLFERAYLLVYEENMDKQSRRLWKSWEDYMREWVGRPEFCNALPELLEGEDEDFTRYIQTLAEDEKSCAAVRDRKTAA
jgi:hypothetical protein